MSLNCPLICLYYFHKRIRTTNETLTNSRLSSLSWPSAWKRIWRDLTQPYDRSPYTDRKIQKSNVTTQRTPPKTSITQRLRTDLGRSAGVTIATQLVWLYRFTGSQPSTNAKGRVIKGHTNNPVIMCTSEMSNYMFLWHFNESYTFLWILVIIKKRHGIH